MPTARDLCTNSALKLGALEDGESLGATETTDCLNVLNSMLDYWAINKLLVYQIVQSQYTWPGATVSRTIGSGGNFNTARPSRIEDGTFFRDSSNIDYQVEIIRNREVYDRIVSKTDQSSFPSALFYDPAYPLGILKVYPIPSSSLTLFLNTWQVLQSFALLTTDLALPPGYQWMIEHNLAVHLEPIFSLPCPDSVKTEAKASKATIERLNNLPIYAETEVAGVLTGRGRDSNILSMKQ